MSVISDIDPLIRVKYHSPLKSFLAQKDFIFYQMTVNLFDKNQYFLKVVKSKMKIKKVNLFNLGCFKLITELYSLAINFFYQTLKNLYLGVAEKRLLKIELSSIQRRKKIHCPKTYFYNKNRLIGI